MNTPAAVFIGERIIFGLVFLVALLAFAEVKLFYNNISFFKKTH
jgi:hypothetical protein